jgi:hypothetical protein
VAGAKLVLVYNRTLAKPEFKEQCKKLEASSVTFTQCDISDLTNCRELVEKVRSIHSATYVASCLTSLRYAPFLAG